MLMNNYFDLIIKKLKDKIEIEEIEIVDNSSKHKGHKFFSPEKFHLQLKIKSIFLTSISRVSAQKLIMKILREDLKDKIHALEISIKK
jgi:stress-induced morphogen|tara:strand:- start:44 stop:307 length:264 start_codon:yes stop_codon:yes gene_type:complete